MAMSFSISLPDDKADRVLEIMINEGLIRKGNSKEKFTELKLKLRGLFYSAIDDYIREKN